MRLDAAMKRGGGGGRIPTEDEVEVAEILLNLPKLWSKSELVSRYSFTWNRKKKRSVLDLESESSPSPSPSPLPVIDEGETSSSVGKILNTKARDDLMKMYNRMQQEGDIIKKKQKLMETLHQELTYKNLELKAQGKKINYSRNMEDYHIWNSTMKTFDQRQITMFAPATPQQQQHCVQQYYESGFGLFNQIDPRVDIHGGTYDFMASSSYSSQPLDQSKYLVMDSDLRVRAAAAARKRRMKENTTNSLLAMKL